ncbi:MAG: hypothetical protein Q9174_003845 [Haloplaca sp. 1 TL-2023]
MDRRAYASPVEDINGPDIENSFFKSWALRNRSSQFSSTSDISPAGTPATASISPKTIAGPRRSGRPRLTTRSTESQVPQIKGGSGEQREFVSDLGALPHRGMGVPHDQRSEKHRNSKGSSTSKGSSNTSSLGRRALVLIKRPTIVRSLTGTKDKPTWFPDGSTATTPGPYGYGGEDPLRKAKDRFIESPPNEVPPDPLPTPATPATSALPKSKSLRVTHSAYPPHRSDKSYTSTDSSSPENKRHSIVSRTKRFFGMQTSSSSRQIPIPLQERRHSRAGATQDTLYGVTIALGDLEHTDHRVTPPSTSTSTSNLSTASIAGKSRHTPRGLFRPSYRRYKPTGHSSSSSVRNVMFGNPPLPSPAIGDMYIGSDSQQYSRVELTDANAPTYLPSEARRIGTPPLPSSDGSKRRGFFFDYNAPRSVSEQGRGSSSGTPIVLAPLPLRPPRSDSAMPMPLRSPGARIQRNEDDVDWFRVRVGAKEVEEERDRFELNVPEHLPSSPLCPRHPKHKSGGKGVCVYHGRNKIGPDDVDVPGPWR